MTLLLLTAILLTSCAPPADGPDPLDWDRKFAEMEADAKLHQHEP